MHHTHTPWLLALSTPFILVVPKKNVVKLFKPRPIWWRCSSYLFCFIFSQKSSICLELAFNFISHHLGNFHSQHLWMPSNCSFQMVCDYIPNNCFPQGLAKTKKLVFVHNLQAFSPFLVTSFMWNLNSKALVSWKYDYGFSPSPSNKYLKKY
jgi:hypothetical protein